ncbi:MAG: Ig-like domain-containing protein, partial [Myxococcota bacterium]|nr:Ig-like domain-containing protein [Myxococcota bacterium]
STPPTPRFEPAPGGVDVDPAATLRVAFGEAVALASLSERVVLREAGGEVAGRVVPDADATGARFVPDAPLAPGASYALTVLAGVRDTVGNASAADAASSFTVRAESTVAAPAIEAVDPASPTNAAAVVVSGRSEAGLRVRVSGPGGSAEAPAAADGSFAIEIALVPDAAQTLEVRALDDAGGTSDAASVAVVQDGTAPVVEAVEPGPGALARLDTAVSVAFNEAIAADSLAGNLRLLLDGAPVAATLGLSGGGRVAVLQPATALAPDREYRIEVLGGLLDLAGNALAAPAEVVFRSGLDDRVPGRPVLAPVASPTPDTTLSVSGTAFPGDEIVVTGGAGPASSSADASGAFSVDVGLRPDRSQVLVVTARNPANGATAAASLQVVQDSTPPSLSIDSPADAATVPTDRVAVTGAAADATGIATLTVDGVRVAPAGGRYQAQVALDVGANSIAVVATDAAGNRASLARSVVSDPLEPGEEDTEPPLVRIDSPASLAVVGESTVVSGTVVDAGVIVSLLVGDVFTLPDASGVFSTPVDVLESGAIGVTATDAAGNVGTATVDVLLDAQAPVVTLDPLPARTADLSLAVGGTSEAGVTVSIAGGERGVETLAGPDGRFDALVPLRAETTNLLLVAATDAVGNRSVPIDRVVVHDARGPGVVDVEPADGAANVAPDAAVRVRFSDALDPASVPVGAIAASDRDGAVAGEISLSPGGSVLSFTPTAPFAAGSEVVVVVSGALADLGGQTLGAEVITRFSVAAAPTRVRGVVISADGAPVEGARVSVVGEELEGETGAQGNFAVSGVPAGLRTLEIDASGVGSFSPVMRDVQVEAGTDNLLPRPVILTPIDRASARLVDGGSDQMLSFGGDLEGFELEVFAASATFPNGKANGFVTATAIDPSDIPGRLADGTIPSLLVNLEPGGTRFEPPCAVRFPNRTDLPPGTPVTIFSFEGSVSDVEELCAGVVSEDGASVVSTEPCVEHFSFVGFFPDAGAGLDAPGDARAFLEGRVVDAAGAGVPNVLVDVAASESRVRTDESGRYVLPLPQRNLFALRVLALVPTSLSSADGSEQLAAYRSELVEPAPAGTTPVPDIVVDRLFLAGDVSLVNERGLPVGVGAATRFDPDGALVEIGADEARALQVFVLAAGADDAFDTEPLAALDAVADPLGPFAVSRYATALAGSLDAEAEAAVPVRPGDLLRIVGFAPALGYVGWTDLRVPTLAEAGGVDLRVDLALHPPEVGLTVRRAFVDEAGERVAEAVPSGGRVSNGDQYLEITSRFTVRGEAPPEVAGLGLHGRFTTLSNLGETLVPFDVPAGEAISVLDLRAAFPVELSLLEAARIVSTGFVEVASNAGFSLDRRLPVEVLGTGAPETVERFQFAVLAISASAPDPNGESAVRGETDAAQPGSLVTVLNTVSLDTREGFAAGDGGFEIPIPAASGDVLRVFFTDVAARPDTLFLEVPEDVAGAEDEIDRLIADPRQIVLRDIGNRGRVRALGVTRGGAARVLGSSDGVVFTSGDPAIVQVADDGTLRARAAGTTFVEVAIEGARDRSEIRVEERPRPTAFLGAVGADYGPEIGIADGRGRVGDTVVITGEGFLDDPFAHTVSFGEVEAQVVGGGPGEIRVLVPEGLAPGVVSVRVTGAGVLSDGLQLEVREGPVLTRASEIAVFPGDVIRVFGVGFADLAGTGIVLDADKLEDTPVTPQTVDAASVSFVLPDLPVSPSIRVRVGEQDSNRLVVTIMERVDYMVSVPSGSGLTPDALRIDVGVHTSETPAATGDVSLLCAKDVPTALSAVDADGDPVLLGIASPEHSAPKELSPRSTADFLVWFALGLGGIPPDGFGPVFDIIHEKTGPLGDRIDAGLAEDPKYLKRAADDPEFLDALGDALGSAIDDAIAFQKGLGDTMARNQVRERTLLWMIEQLVVPAAWAQGPPVPQNIPESVEPNQVLSGLSVTGLASEKITVTNTFFRYVSGMVEDTSNPSIGPLLPHAQLGTVLAGIQNFVFPGEKIPSNVQGVPNFFMNGFDKNTELKGDMPFSVNGGPFRLELIGPSARADLQAAQALANFEFTSSRFDNTEQVEAYIITTLATWINELAIPLLEVLSGLNAGGDEGKKAFDKAKKVLEKIKSAALAVQSQGGAVQTAIEKQSTEDVGKALKAFMEKLNGKDLLLQLLEIFTKEVQSGFAPAPEGPGPVTKFTATEVFEAIAKDFGDANLQGSAVTTLLENKLKDLAGQVPLVKAIKKVIEFIQLVIKGANLAKAFRDVYVAEPIVEFTFSISEANAEGLDPAFAPAETVASGDFTTTLRGKGFNTDLSSYISGSDLFPNAPETVIRSCFTTTPAPTLATPGFNTANQAGCQSPADLFEFGRRNYIAFKAKPGAGVPPDGIVLAEVTAISCPTGQGGSCAGIGPQDIVELELKVPSNAFTGPLTIRNKRRRTQSLLFTVEVECFPPDSCIKAFITSRNGTIEDRELSTSLDPAEVGAGADPIPFPGITPWAIEFNRNALFAYITDFRGGKLYRLDARNNVVENNPVPVGAFPRDVAVSPSGNLAIVANSSGQIPVIDTRTMQVVKLIPVSAPGEGRSVSFRPDSRRAYVLFAQGLFSGNQSGSIVVIDTDEEQPDSPTYLTAIATVQIPNMDEPAAFRVQNQDRAWVVAKGDKTNAGPGPHLDISIYDIGEDDSPPTIVTQTTDLIAPSDGQRPPPIGSLDTAFLGPIDIGFPRNGRPFAYLPAFGSGNVAALQLGPVPTPFEGQVVGVSVSDFRKVQVPDFELETNAIPSVVTFAIPARIKPVLREEIINDVSLPRRIDVSQNGEFALVTRNRTAFQGDVLLVIDDAVFDVVDQLPSQGYDLSDVPLECAALHANGNLTGFEGACGALGEVFFDAQPAPGSSSFRAPVFSLGAPGGRPEDVAIEPIVGIVEPPWGACVNRTFEIQAA